MIRAIFAMFRNKSQTAKEILYLIELYKYYKLVCFKTTIALLHKCVNKYMN